MKKIITLFASVILVASAFAQPNGKAYGHNKDRDVVYNDDRYEYDSVGFPFLKNLGFAIYEHELKRSRKNVPDLSAFRFEWVEKKNK